MRHVSGSTKRVNIKVSFKYIIPQGCMPFLVTVHTLMPDSRCMTWRHGKDFPHGQHQMKRKGQQWCLVRMRGNAHRLHIHHELIFDLRCQSRTIWATAQRPRGCITNQKVQGLQCGDCAAATSEIKQDGCELCHHSVPYMLCMCCSCCMGGSKHNANAGAHKVQSNELYLTQQGRDLTNGHYNKIQTQRN